MTVTPTDLKRLLSVRDLVASRTSESDRWNLALVQRDEKWDTVRMRHLLDSMLAGYPIGAILLCRVEDTSEVIDREGGVRTVRRASAAEWQLVDGQQRINAFYSMLTGGGRYGKFYLHMTMRREPPGPVQKRSTKDRHLPYIVWRAGDTIDEFPNREMHIDLSRWSSWASTKTTVHATPSDAEGPAARSRPGVRERADTRVCGAGGGSAERPVAQARPGPQLHPVPAQCHPQQT